MLVKLNWWQLRSSCHQSYNLLVLMCSATICQTLHMPSVKKMHNIKIEHTFLTPHCSVNTQNTFLSNWHNNNKHCTVLVGVSSHNIITQPSLARAAPPRKISGGSGDPYVPVWWSWNVIKKHIDCIPARSGKPKHCAQSSRGRVASPAARAS